MSRLPDNPSQTTTAAGASVELHIQARTRDLGDGFTVRRLLPSSERRMIGPFIFVDHFGPLRLDPGRGLDVRPHPHINLATVTYLFEGEILHRDSLGSEQLLRPGAVNWMTAGRGIVHSERSPSAARAAGPRMHGLQTWVALPRVHEEVAPSFQHHAEGSLPAVERPGARLRVLAGAAFGATAPVDVLSPLFYVEARLERGAVLPVGPRDLGAASPGEPSAAVERAAYVVAGAVTCDGQIYRPGEMLVFRAGSVVELAAAQGGNHDGDDDDNDHGDGARIVLLGGAPLDGERHIWWNFVSSAPERIQRARDDWRAGRFPKVPGDEVEFTPLPPA